MQPRLVIAAWAALLLAIGPIAAVRADEADDQYRLAAVHYQAHRWDLADAEFRTFLAEHPRDARVDRAKFYLGETLVQLRDFPAAAQQFNEAQRSADAELARKALFRTGEANYLAGRHVESELDLEKFCERFPGDKLSPYALAYRGEMALADERIDDAERHFRAALDSNLDGPTADDCRLGLAQAWHKQKRVDDAQQLLLHLADGGGAKGAEARFRLATHAFAAGDYQTAETAFAAAEKAAAQKPAESPATHPSLADRAHLARGRSLFQLKKYDEAANELGSLTDHGLLRAEARYWLGLTRKAQGDWEGAAPLLAAAADGATTAERQTSALAELTICYAGAHKIVEARTAFKSLLAEDPADELLRSTSEILAAAALAAGDVSWAAELYQSLAGDDQPPACAAQGLLGLAQAQRADKKADSAEATLTALIERYPQEPCAAEASLLRGQILEQLDRTDDALTAYEHVAKLYATNATADEALTLAAQLCTTTKRWNDAAGYYKQLLARPGHDRDGDAILYRWACVALRADHRSEANELFDRLRSDYPDSEFYGEATCRVAQQAIYDKHFDQADELLASLDGKTLPADVHARALYLQGQSAAGQEQWEQVAPPLAKLLAECDGSSLCLAAEYWIAEAEYHQQHFDQAALRFAALEEKLSAASADEAPSWRVMVPLRRAQIFANRSEWSESLAAAEAIARNFPNFSQQYEADYVIGRAHAARAEFDQARQAYRRVTASTTGGKTETAAMAQWMIGESFMHQRDYRAALREYLKVDILYCYPRWQAAALLQAGKCQEQLQQPGDAAATYQRLHREHPDTKFDQEAALRLAQLRR